MSWTLRLAGAATAAAAIAAAAIAYRRRQRTPGPRVMVASKAVAKLNAAKAAMNASEVTGASAPSLVADQPVGMETTMLGAANRLRHICETGGANGYDYAVAIENGIVRLQ